MLEWLNTVGIDTKGLITGIITVSTPERICIGGPGQKSITGASKKAPDIGGLLAFVFQLGGVASGVASGRGRRERRLEWARR